MPGCLRLADGWGHSRGSARVTPRGHRPLGGSESLGLFLVVTLVAGCNEPHPIALLQNNDSADVKLVDVTEPDLGTIRSCLSPEEPLARLEPGSTGRGMNLDEVVAVLADVQGSLYLLMGSASPRLCRYRLSGEEEWCRGRLGSGPGEFREPRSITPYRGDSVAIWDQRLGRLSVFSPGGDLGRIVEVPPSTRTPSGVFRHALPDGSFVGSEEGFFVESGPGDSGWYSASVIRIEPDGTNYKTTGPHLLAETGLDALGRRRPVSLGGHGDFLPTANGFAWARTDIGEIRVFSGSGALLEVIRLRWKRRRLGRSDWARHFSSIVPSLIRATPWATEEEILAVLKSSPRARRAPVLLRAVGFIDSVLWVEPYNSPDEGGRTLLGIDLNAGRLCRGALPAGARILGWRHDGVVLAYYDEWDRLNLQVFPAPRFPLSDSPT